MFDNITEVWYYTLYFNTVTQKMSWPNFWDCKDVLWTLKLKSNTRSLNISHDTLHDLTFFQVIWPIDADSLCIFMSASYCFCVVVRICTQISHYLLDRIGSNFTCHYHIVRYWSPAKKDFNKWSEMVAMATTPISGFRAITLERLNGISWNFVGGFVLLRARLSSKMGIFL